MFLKFKASIVKESLLLLRDKAGLAMLFVMPMALVLLMTLLQDSTLKLLDERKTPILIINKDGGTFGKNIVDGLNAACFFEVHQKINKLQLTEELLKEQVLRGNFRVGIVIRKGASKALRNKIKQEIQNQFPEDEEQLFEMDELVGGILPEVDLYFDPIIKNDFKHAMTSALREFSYAVQAKMIFEIYTELLKDFVDIEMTDSNGFQNMIEFKEQYATEKQSDIIPNSTQHNVPAWTIFAMFFIVIPLAGNIIKERESGLAMRLRTMPGSNLAVILGKASVYFVVGIIQAAFMLLVGVFILPLFGAPALVIGTNIFPLLFITISVSLAASGYGIVIGTIATSQEQSSIFGSISVVILAALGGIWVPTFMMSDMMVSVSKFSPLNWGLTGYYNIFLRNASVSDITSNMLLLVSFFLICIMIAFLYNRHKKK